jgi:pilus assembly protein CpaF
MEFDLRNLVDNILKDYRPLQNIEKTFMNQNHETNFRNLVNDKIKDLSKDLQERILNEFFAWGPLHSLIDENEIFDIIIQGERTIFFENSKGMQKHSDSFLSAKTFQNFTERLMRDTGILINQRDPYGNGQVNEFRVHLIIPPVANEITITLRKHKKTIHPMSYYKDSGFITDFQMQLINEIIESKKNFLIVGPTGSGKTTFLNSLVNTLDHFQRLVVIEDTSEIQTQLPLAVKLLTREVCPDTLKKVSMEDLVKQSLRMRPDRIIVGEVRGQEAKDLLQALATGHSGSMGTIHAESAKQALIRLEMLIQMGAPQWSLNSIRQLIQMSLHYFIVLKEDRLEKGIKEICKIGSHESFGLLLENKTAHERQPLYSLS